MNFKTGDRVKRTSAAAAKLGADPEELGTIQGRIGAVFNVVWDSDKTALYHGTLLKLVETQAA